MYNDNDNGGHDDGLIEKGIAGRRGGIYREMSATGSADAGLLVVVMFPLNLFRISSCKQARSISSPGLRETLVEHLQTNQALLAIVESRHQV
jgi:hypothetical protein